jgi:uncharacterized repeat protein (TIGR03803 family)
MTTIKNKYALVCMVMHLLINTFVSAQYTKLYEFTKNNDLSTPTYSQPITDGVWFYDVTTSGGSNGLGEVYKVKPDGTGFTKLLDFKGSNGSNPNGSLLLDHGFLYGMTTSGGASQNGCIFKIDTLGGNYSKLHDFDQNGNNVASPLGALTIKGSTLFGVGKVGKWNAGGIFKINTDGSNFAKLFDFGGVPSSANGVYPIGTPVLVGDTLYGMTSEGGSIVGKQIGYGCIYKLKIDGTGFKKVYDFNGTDGYKPYGSLIYDQGVFYGMTSGFYDITNYFGNVFKITTGGVYTNLLNFDQTGTYGTYPFGSLTLLNGVLYGTTSGQGYHGGTIFKVNTDGTGKTRLLQLDLNNTINGNYPHGTLTALNGELYGAMNGGQTSMGLFFKITTAGSLTKLMDFSKPLNCSYPIGGVLASGSILYGIANTGGSNGRGAVYKINADGSNLEVIYNVANNYIYPNGPIAKSNDTLIWTSSWGGADNVGGVLALKTNGTALNPITDFTYDYASQKYLFGSSPRNTVIISGNTIYGTTPKGGANEKGLIYKINTNGSNKTTLLNFNTTNGAYPKGLPLVSGNTIYCMTDSGGANNKGCIIKLNTDGTNYAKVLDFDGTAKGAYPKGGLVISGNVLYGMTQGGGTNNQGCIFKVNTDGTGYTKLLDFSRTDKGANPWGTLLLSGSMLFGITDEGGLFDRGCLFRINTDGTGFQNMMDFNGSDNGAYPSGNLTMVGTTLYGTTYRGGSGDMGLIFKYEGSKKMPSIIWGNLANITYGTLLDATQLNAQADIPGTFVYSAPAGTKLNAGAGQVLQVDFTPNDLTNYFKATKSVTITVTKGTPVITWSNPADIGYGTLLDATQLNAVANNVDGGGTFTYTPASGTKLAIGNNQNIKVDFSPTNASNYNTATFTVTINVKTTQTIAMNAISKSIADADFGPAIASSGLTVSYSSSNTAVATIVNGKIHIVALGTSDITASQEGDATYLAAPSITKTLTVKNLSSQTITFNALPAKNVGDQDFALTATASSGLPVTFSSSDQGVATVVNGVVHIVGAGTTIITASQAGNTVYNTADKTQSLIVSPVTSVPTINDDNLVEIYPNPVHGILFVKRDNTSFTMMNLFDVLGHKVLTKSNVNELEYIDVSGLQPGIYFLQVNKTKMVKVIIE